MKFSERAALRVLRSGALDPVEPAPSLEESARESHRRSEAKKELKRAREKERKHPNRLHGEDGLTARQFSMIEVPAAMIPTNCPRCQSRLYYLVVSGRAVAVDCGVPDAFHPTDRLPGRGVSHVGTGCPGTK